MRKAKRAAGEVIPRVEPEAVTAVLKPPSEPRPEPGFRVPESVKIHPTRLNPAPYNAQKMTPAEFEALKAGIRSFGFVENVVVQKHSSRFGPLVIIGGHQRLNAVREICVEDNCPMPELPCVVLDVDDRTAKRLNVALNRVHGTPDAQLLAELLEDIDREQRVTPEEVSMMGFEDDEFRGLLHLADPPVPTDSETFARSITISLKFNDLPTRDAVKAKLDDRAKKQKCLNGDVVMGLLRGTKKVA